MGGGGCGEGDGGGHCGEGPEGGGGIGKTTHCIATHHSIYFSLTSDEHRCEPLECFINCVGVRNE